MFRNNYRRECRKRSYGGWIVSNSLLRSSVGENLITMNVMFGGAGRATIHLYIQQFVS